MRLATTVVHPHDRRLISMLHPIPPYDRPWASRRPGRGPAATGRTEQLSDRRGRKAVALASVLIALGVAPAASAQTTRCHGNPYAAIDPSAFPTVSNVVAINVPRLTGGRAPRCFVADAVGGYIQIFWTQHQRFARSLSVHGALWDAGIWRLTYQTRESKQNPGNLYWHAVARHGRQRVTMDLGS